MLHDLFINTKIYFNTRVKRGSRFLTLSHSLSSNPIERSPALLGITVTSLAAVNDRYLPRSRANRRAQFFLLQLEIATLTYLML